MRPPVATPRPRLDILYRGSLSSCNYTCGYCPFAKTKNTREELAQDAAALDRFVGWVEEHSERPMGVLFTPWGEALVRRPYRHAIVRLSRAPHVQKVAIQTNLSSEVTWLADANARRVGICATHHPDQVRFESFIERCLGLLSFGVSLSVGIVGLQAHLNTARALRQALPDSVYVWINAPKSQEQTGALLEHAFTEIDPLFSWNVQRHSSRGRSCRTGASVISVNAEGQVRRCHFVPEVLGSLYEDELDDLLGEQPCPNSTCGCHIGHVHLDHLGLGEFFGPGLLERALDARQRSRVLPVLS